MIVLYILLILLCALNLLYISKENSERIFRKFVAIFLMIVAFGLKKYFVS